ncbi:MAG: ribonuclease R [Bacteroidetes bacterium]|nr:ribonuclease R [Bacteroidota bacterium]MBT6685278.1 ribonuclease R [Bacteroidota bacterium]MBT7141725.1 ribonuclease R [Bacteroidota bacterium]MBT7491423.1 ribonuclease R [Bacteroidota bacterium]
MSKKKKTKSITKIYLKNKIVAIFRNGPSKTFNYKQIANKLNIRDLSQKQMIMAVLSELKESGRLEEVYRGKYRNKVREGYFVGTVNMSAKGRATIHSNEIKEEIFVSVANLNNALHKDLVKVYLFAQRKKTQHEAEVVEIIKRNKTNFVGTVEISQNFAFLIPDSKFMPFDIFVPLKLLNNAKNGQKAIAEIIEWEVGAKNPLGKIVELLGNAGDNEVEIHAILAEFDLPYRYPENVEKIANSIPEKISESEIASRRDFRNIPTFTIDPIDAKDFDDALSIEELENGNYEIGVHIADVTHYVSQGSVLDKEAFNRATSVYLVDRVIPMLPEKLSNKICSLRPNEEKLCFSAVFEMDSSANIKKQWFGNTIINSDRRFNYAEAQQIIDNDKGVFCNELKIFDGLSKILRKNRFNNNSISFDRTEVKFELDEKSFPISISFCENEDTHSLIEEFMLLANKRVAEIISKVDTGKKPKTFVYRIHDLPDPDKISNFSKFLKKFGYGLKTNSANNISSSLNNLFKQLEGKKEQNLIETIAIRTMAKAKYSTQNIGHYGLAFPFYTHFTSPIRRYPDIMVHRMLKHYLENGRSLSSKTYEDKCNHCSEMEQSAANAERASIKYKMIEFIQDKIGEQFYGIISGVSPWGIYVELLENKIEGMVSIRNLEDDFYIFDEANYCIVGQYHKKKYQLGDNVKIEIVRADIIKKQIDFVLK